uniref:Uncharacterized protein n=1 Tax=Lygus hesperus TaxID=30085 RepID=A0A0A9Y3R8_LYGHE
MVQSIPFLDQVTHSLDQITRHLDLETHHSDLVTHRLVLKTHLLSCLFIGPQNSPFGPLNPQSGFTSQLPPPQFFPSSQFGPPISPFGPFSPHQPVSPFGPFLPPLGPTGLQMYPAGIRSSNCPPFLQQLCSQPKLNFLAPMCAPGTSSSPFQPCISRSVNGVCPPMTVCVSSLPGLTGLGQNGGGQNGAVQSMPVQTGMGQYGNVFKPQVNIAEATIGQLASQISRQLVGRTQATASESSSASASSQAQQSSAAFSGQQLTEANFGDQLAGVLSRRQLSPSSTTKVSTLMRSLAD